MELVSEPVEVVGRGAYQEDDPKFGEFIRVSVDGEGMSRRYTLDKTVNGSIKVGDKGRLHLVSTMRAEAHQNRDGKLGVHYREKFKVVGLLDAA